MKTINDRSIYSVTEVNSHASSILEQVILWVEGEISEYSNQKYSTFSYFCLKDPETDYKVHCIIRSEYLQSLGFQIKDGDKIIVLGKFRLWEKGGKFELDIRRVELFGEGEILKRLEELKRKLQTEGVFAVEHKRPIPEYPLKIGLVTSVNGAAWFDFKKNSIEEYPFLELILRDVYVQGQYASDSICKAIEELDNMGLDVIVLSRGGGSLDDLLAFNTESVARAIYACKTPLLTAVGHEINLTIADITADYHVSTPSIAATFLVRNYKELFSKMDRLRDELTEKMLRYIYDQTENLDVIRGKMKNTENIFRYLPDKLLNLNSRLLFYKNQLVDDKSRYLVDVYKLFKAQANNILLTHKRRLDHLEEKLKILSPLTTLDRGYSIIRDSAGKVIKSVSDVAIGNDVNIQLSKGLLVSTIKEKKD